MEADAIDRELETDFRSSLASGDQNAFGTAAERYRRRSHVHCYRMVGSLEDAISARLLPDERTPGPVGGREVR